jgi:amino acid transporter
LLDVVRRALPAFPMGLFTAIPLFAVSNSALVNSVMASRLLYGMSQQQLLPAWLATVHPRRRTPTAAVAVVFAVAAGFALSGTLAGLAGTASVLLLVVFLLVHVALIRVKRGPELSSGFRVPLAVPVLGAASVCGLAAFAPVKSWLTVAAMVSLGLVVVGIRHFARRHIATTESEG